MKQYGVEEKFVRVYQGLYSRMEMRVVSNRGKSRWFVVDRGLPFNIDLMGMTEDLESTRLGVKSEGIGAGHLCMLMMFWWWT